MNKYIKQNEFNEILSEHYKWLKSGKRDGMRAMFDSCDIENINMTDPNIGYNGPDILSLVGFINCVIHKIDFSNISSLNGVSFRKSKLIDCVFDNISLKNTSFVQSELENIDFSKAKFEFNNFYHAYAVNCNFTGANFKYTGSNNVKFVDCNLSGADFKAADISKAAFINCNVSKTSFAGADLTGAIFNNTPTDFSNYLLRAKTDGVKIDGKLLVEESFEGDDGNKYTKKVIQNSTISEKLEHVLSVLLSVSEKE